MTPAMDEGRWRAQWIALGTALCVCIAVIIGGLAQAGEEQFRQWRDSLQRSEASGQIVVLEIDGRSIQAIDEWPWSRGLHAQAVAELDRLGAAQIAFDVDLSSRSDAAQDMLLARTLKATGGTVVLPTFRQLNLAGGRDTITETTPLPQFAQHAFLASVNVHPRADGKIVHYPYGETTAGIARPSLASMVAERSGRIDEEFRVDQAIDPTTIPRISFVDLIEGRVAQEQVAGRKVIIGATAIELGDRYPTALYGALPGVLLQAQAAETLLQDRVRADASMALAFLLAAAMLLLSARWQRTRANLSAAAIVLVGLTIAGALALDALSLLYWPLVPVLVLTASYLVAHRILRSALTLRDARGTHALSGLPNRSAMLEMRGTLNEPGIAVARIADFEQLELVVGAEHIFDIDKGIAQRMAMLAFRGKIFRLERGLFGWFVPEEQTGDLAQYFDTARALLNAPLILESKPIKLSANFGSSTQIVEDAIVAAEHAHRTGTSWSTNVADLQAQSRTAQNIMLELDEALESGAIWVAYQPKYRFADQTIAGAECLVRWNSPTMGTIGPDHFIPVLESKGRMQELTMFVLGDALRRLGEAESGNRKLNLAVNVSAQLLADAQFVEAVTALLETHYRQSANVLTIEITESAPLADSTTAKHALNRLREAGARISIDDYGTGQATLTYLQGFPANEVKLDQSFVKNFTSSISDEIMVRSTIEMAQALGFEIVAEGIEDAGILEALAALGCDYGQGWHIGKPVPWDAFVTQHFGGTLASAAA